MKTSNRTPGREAFTLLELMVVIAIIVIVAGLTVTGLGASSARQLGAAGNTVADLINEARQNAISRNLPTAFIMVNKSGNPQYDNRLFVLAELGVPPGSPAGTMPTWQQVSKWTMLPNGVIAYATVAANEYFSMATGAAGSTTPSALPVDFNLTFQGTSIGSASGQTAYEVFLPSGALLGATTSPILTLTTGIMNNGDSPTYFGKTGAGGVPVNYYEITINPYTGMPKIDRP